MNNESVAWYNADDSSLSFKNHGGGWQPLYTHPAKELDEQFKKGFEAGKEEGWKAHKFHHPAKTLTDEEIQELSEEHLDMDWQTGVIDFARAILRKAQDK